MIFLLGLDSQFVGLEAVGTSLLDMMPKHRNKPWVREMLLAVIVAFSALLAIPMCAPGGIYLFKLFDYYGASGFNLLFLSSAQCLAVTYIYGAEKMWRNVTEMLGYKLNKFWLVCWQIITPVSCIGMILLKVIMFKSLVYSAFLFGSYLGSFLVIFGQFWYFLVVFRLFVADLKVKPRCILDQWAKT